MKIKVKYKGYEIGNEHRTARISENESRHPAQEIYIKVDPLYSLMCHMPAVTDSVHFRHAFPRRCRTLHAKELSRSLENNEDQRARKFCIITQLC